jgi:hypothetical protein
MIKASMIFRFCRHPITPSSCRHIKSRPILLISLALFALVYVAVMGLKNASWGGRIFATAE